MIEKYLNTETFTTKKELIARTGLNEREVRRKISELKLEKPVIFNSQTNGYRLMKDLSKLNREQLIIEGLEIKHSMNDIKARIEALNSQIGVYEKAYKELEVLLLRKTDEELYDNRRSDRAIN